MAQSRDELFEATLQSLDIAFEDEIRGGANYEAALAHEGQFYVSGMILRMRGKIVVTGRVGETCSLQDARHAAQICVVARRGIAS